MPEILLYAGLGILMDIFVTIYTRAVSCRRKWLAALTGVVITILGLVIIERVITSRNLGLIISYGIGTGIGCLVGMSIRLRGKHE